MPPRRRRLLAVLAAAAAVLVAAAAAAYVVTRPSGDVSDPDVPFAADELEPVPEPPAPPPATKRRARVPSLDWPRFGYTKDHRRAFWPPQKFRGPYRVLWKRRSPGLLEFPPAISKGMLVQLAGNGELRVTRIRRGRVLWRKRIGHLSASTPTVEGAYAYATLLERSRDVPRGRVVSVRVRDGRRRWVRELPSRSESSPLVHRGRVFFGAEDGSLYCLRARTGEVIWRYRADGAVKASPTLYKGVLYFGDYSGQVQAVRASDGRRVWAAPVSRRTIGGGRFYSTAAVAFGRVYVGSTDGRMYSLALEDGRVAWARQTGGYVYASPAVQNVPVGGPTVFFGSYDGVFYALDARNGRTRWRFRSGGRISGSATIIGDVVFFADLGRSRTYGLGTTSGRKLFQRRQGGYDAVVSDGRILFLNGRRALAALLPADRGRPGT